ncbi:MAG: hypothetical protein GF346_05610, partial [Candidatus Eisenbacteria bacterium]|nr:hypothetical protein [Candidatus Latescibacterota bacterium]MBD3301905.1 hypothetical protein [Candidatus Eisenbacteria bacterium]
MKRIGWVILLLAGLSAAESGRGADRAPRPIREALAAVDLDADRLRFDRHDMSLYGGDRWRLRFFDAWIDRPLRIPGDAEVLQRNLLAAADSPARLFSSATARLETAVRRGLIGDPIGDLRAALPERDPLTEAAARLWPRAGRMLLPEERRSLRRAEGRLPDSVSAAVAVILE